jgi:hypothetical protein
MGQALGGAQYWLSIKKLTAVALLGPLPRVSASLSFLKCFNRMGLPGCYLP